jgi:uncharacterized protein (TIGR02588 family)
VSERDPRTAAEWTAFACSSVVLAVLVVLIALQIGNDRPAAPVATLVGGARAVGDLHHVDVRLTNDGDDTAANVQVSAELVIDGEATTADQTVDFLAGGEDEELVFVFEDDPANGELTISVASFAEP